jgi:hypothetical protein
MADDVPRAGGSLPSVHDLRRVTNWVFVQSVEKGTFDETAKVPAWLFRA